MAGSKLREPSPSTGLRPADNQQEEVGLPNRYRIRRCSGRLLEHLPGCRAIVSAKWSVPPYRPTSSCPSFARPGALFSHPLPSPSSRMSQRIFLTDLPHRPGWANGTSPIEVDVRIMLCGAFRTETVTDIGLGMTANIDIHRLPPPGVVSDLFTVRNTPAICPVRY